MRYHSDPSQISLRVTGCAFAFCCLLPEKKDFFLLRRTYVATNNLTQFGVNAQVRILTSMVSFKRLRCIIFLEFSSQVTFGETLVIFTIIFLFAMIVAGVYNGNHEMYFDCSNDKVLTQNDGKDNEFCRNPGKTLQPGPQP